MSVSARGHEEAQRHEPAGHGQRRAGQAARVGPGRAGHLRHDLAQAPPAVAELDEAEGPGVGAPAQREPVHQAELGLLHLGGAVAERDRLAQAQRLRGAEDLLEEGGIPPEGAEPVLAREDAQEGGRGVPVRRRGQLVGAHPARTRGALPQDEGTHHQGADAERLVVRRPALERVDVPCRLRAPRPRRGVGERVLRLPAQDPRVAARALHPAARAVRPGLALAKRPVGEDGGEAALGEVGPEAGHDARADPVARAPAVAEEEPRLRRDDVGRVRHHEVETLAGHGGEQVALAPLDVANAVEPGIEAGEGERAGVEVDPHDALRVARGEERLHAPAAAQVEDAPGRLANGEARQEERGRAHPEHVVRLDGERDRVRAVEGQDEPLRHRQRDERPDEALLALDQPQRGQVLDREGIERATGLGLGDGLVQREELDERVEGRGLREPAPVERQVGGAVLGADRGPEGRRRLGPGIAVRVEDVPQPVDGVPAAGVKHRSSPHRLL